MKRRWLLLTAVLLIVGALPLLSGAGLMRPVEAASAEAVAPMQRGLSLITARMQNAATFVARIGTLGKENQRLRREVDELNQRVVELQEAGLENQRLRTLLDYLQANPEREYITANIIGRSKNNLDNSLSINKGRKDGVQEGMTLVAGGGLVGTVVEAYDFVSKAIMITDHSSSVPAMILRSRNEGIVVGVPGYPLSLELVEQESDVQPGDLVITSGLGGSYPEGVLIGQVTQVVGRPQDLFKEIRVRPGAQLDGLEEVLLVMDFRPAPIP